MNHFANRILLFMVFCIAVAALIASLTSREVQKPLVAVDDADSDAQEAVMAEIRQLRDDISTLHSDVAELRQTRPSTPTAPVQPLLPTAGSTVEAPVSGVADLQTQMNDLRTWVEGIRTELVQSGGLRPGSNEVLNANSAITDPQATIKDKLAALRTLRRADAVSDDVVKQMAKAYYTTDSPNAQADIFRQLDGVTTPELKAPLLDAVSKATNTRVRQEAAGTLARYLPDPDVAAWLTHLAANDPAGSVRREAARSLKRLKKTN